MTERLKLQNEYLTVEVVLRGAELKRIIRSCGADLLWPGNQHLWHNSAPWLFPVVGRLQDDCFVHNGVRYSMPIHGFAREMLFSPEEHTAHRLVLAAHANEETRACYPFDFTLRIIYELTDNRLLICAEVENHGGGDMLFSIGGHPGLCCEEDDRLIFDAVENAPLHRLSAAEHLLKPSDMHFHGTQLRLTAALFRDDAMILHRPASRSITLQRRHGERIVLSYDPVTWLGIWSRAEDPLRYVCLEPWLGVDSPLELHSAELHDKPDIITLPAGETFRFHMAIEDQTEK